MGVELAGELRRLEREGRTGILRAGDGAFYFAGGAIAFVDCRRTTGLDRLVVDSGVVSAEDWHRAGAGEAAELIGRPRLEALAVLSVYDAAYFLLASPVVPEFRPAPPHWLAPVCRIPVRELVRECARRGDPKSGPWPAELVDRAPVVPVRGPRRRRRVLSCGHAEVLAAADSRRSVVGIARELRRTTYGCLVAVRELTAAGLIEVPVPRAATDAEVAASPNDEQFDTARVIAGQVARGRVVATPLPRRRMRSAIPESAHDRWEPVDRDVLTRIVAALEELA
ncbi:hypothetical protein [Nocardia sp. NPDC005366]|uniref:hypothetical protein n=1 Tax=Nocardia sp. NPDC005366 TaxID=3156878 RepID=UPI0033BB390A